MLLPTIALGLAAAGLAAAASTPSGCSADYGGSFELTVALTGQNGGNVQKRGALVVTLSGGVLTDSAGRIGEIAADRQFQFDAAPGQPDAIYTDGWSVCAGGALALQGSTAFFQCLSGSFYNLYDQRVGGQCQQVQLSAVAVGAAAVVALSQGPDGQVQATSAMSAAALTAVSQATPGTPATLTLATLATLQPVVQISDGQIQATGPAPSPSAASPPGQSPTPGSTFAPTNGTSTRPASSSPASSRPATAAPASARPSSAASLVGAGAHIVAVVVAVAAAVVLV